ncbi:MAG: EF-P beta-lysylation protein EpmB [Methylohalobius sp. ZOD2]
MNPIIPQASPLSAWQRELAEGFRSPAELLDFLELSRHSFDVEAAAAFSFRVPRDFAARMHPGDPDDPLLRQVLPCAEETHHTPGFVSDPVGDSQAKSAPGVLHKYHGRLLLVTTGACAIHCRYCFRREFPYQNDQLTPSRWQPALQYIRNQPAVTEVILSGGDPLMLSNARLAQLIEALAAIPHLRRIRLHSRLPIVLPSRIEPQLLEVLTGSRLDCVMVVHANHPNEIDDRVAQHIHQLRRRLIPVFNQSTLLRGVNDDIESLVALQESLFEAGILPYYLHLLDRARGTAHFEVPETTAKSLHEQLRRRLPGYLVPRLVFEQAGAPYKISL